MCGIIGVSANNNAISDIYNGLLMLQHRGQDAAGIVTFDNRFHVKKQNGLVSDLFKDTPEEVQSFTGKYGLGHVRYRTAGGLNNASTQPFLSHYPYGLSLIHNGNLTNYRDLKSVVTKKYHRYLNSNSDSELILGVLSYELTKFTGSFLEPAEIFKAVTETMPQLQGSYSVITAIANHGLLAFRDPYAIRPLIYGKRDNDYMIASESVALESCGYQVVADIQPGEAIYIDNHGTLHKSQCHPVMAKKPCIFEFVYLARPESMIDDISVYKSRLRMGEKLAKQILAANLEIDSVMPVPETSRPIAQAVAEKLQKPYREGLIKNRYIARTFLMPGQSQRQKSIRQKLNTVNIEFRNKNVLLVDDSIVRGNTAKQIVEMVKQAGAKKVYLASASPPIINPDVYGVDMPSRQELIAHNRTIKEIEDYLKVDKLFYQTIEDLVASASDGTPVTNEFSTGCFNFGYATPEVTEELLQQVEQDYLNRDKDLDV